MASPAFDEDAFSVLAFDTDAFDITTSTPSTQTSEKKAWWNFFRRRR